MAIKTNSLNISRIGVTLSNAYSKIDHFDVRQDSKKDVMINVQVAHYANSSSRADNKSVVQYDNYSLRGCNDMPGSLASGSFSYVYDKIKLEAPFSGSTLTDV